MSGNEDFQFTPSWGDIIEQLGLPPDAEAYAQKLQEMLERRDQQIEDHVNEAVRRIVTFNGLGDGTSHSGTAWANTVPVMSVPFTKARDRSLLAVDVSTRGRFDNAAGGWVSFGVQVRDPDGNVLTADTEVVRARFQAAQDGTNQNAAGFQRVAAPAGPLVVRLRVRTDDAGTAWVSDGNCTCSIQVTESR